MNFSNKLNFLWICVGIGLFFGMWQNNFYAGFWMFLLTGLFLAFYINFQEVSK